MADPRLVAMRHIWHLTVILADHGISLPPIRWEKLSDAQLFRLRSTMSGLVYQYSSAHS